MIEKLKIATRSSKLALWQAYHIQALLKDEGIDSELVTFETKGDKILDRSLSKIGSKGLFTEELENSLIQGESHIAVHSAKDLPSQLADNLEIIAFTKREEMHDVLVSDLEIEVNSKLKIGTSSTRRVALLKKYFPHWEIVPMRGNLQTRIEKMRRGDCDALMLAYAGVYRMGYGDLIRHSFDLEQIVPPVGQGSLALEASKNLSSSIKSLVEKVCADIKTTYCLEAERSFLRVMQGGCSVPIFALATDNGGIITLLGGIISLDGKNELKIQKSMPVEFSQKLGETLALELLQKGGKEILEKIKKEL